MYDDDFPKPILMDLLRVKIAIRYVNTEETNFGIVNDHTSTVNRNNEVMAGVEESDKCISKYEYTLSNILRRYKGRPSNLDHLNLYNFVAFHFYKDQVIRPQFFG